MDIWSGHTFNLCRGVCGEVWFSTKIEVVTDSIWNFEPTKDVFCISGFDGKVDGGSKIAGNSFFLFASIEFILSWGKLG